jgi:hypothetical protein
VNATNIAATTSVLDAADAAALEDFVTAATVDTATYTISDAADVIADALIADALIAGETFANATGVTATTVALTTAQATALEGFAALDDATSAYTISDAADVIADALIAGETFANATGVTATTVALTTAQATALEGFAALDDATSAYTISDAAAVLAAEDVTNFPNATGIVVTDNSAGTLSIQEATELTAITTDDTWSYSIDDDPDNIVAEDGTGLSAFVTATVAVTLTTQPSLAQLVAINNATGGAITLDDSTAALSGSAADLVAALTGITSYTGNITALRANTSETIEWLKFTLEGVGERTHGYAFEDTAF